MEADSINGFFDLNITHKPDDKLIERIIEFNYRAIALNWIVDVSNSIPKKGVKKKRNSHANNENIIIFSEELFCSFNNLIKKYYEKLKIFLRITIIFNTQEQLKQVLSSPHIKKYDLVAVLPASTTAYEHACNNQLIDLISFEIGVSNYKPTGKFHKLLVNRSGYFEIAYSQALQSSAKRQELFTMVQYFNIYGKSKNAILSSGASHYLELRNPYDVANLGILFGLSEDKAKCSLSKNCKSLLLTAAGKKYGKTAIIVELIDDEEPRQKRTKLNSSDNISKVTQSISSLTTTEQK